MANKKEKRFIKVYSDGGGVTPLLNRDGTPVITPVPRQYEE